MYEYANAQTKYAVRVGTQIDEDEAHTYMIHDLKMEY